MRDSDRVVQWLCVAVLLVWAPQAVEAQASGEATAEVKEVSRPAPPSKLMPVEVGARVGFSSSRFGEIEGIGQESLSFVTSGATVRWQLAGMHGLQAGVSFVRKGSRIVSGGVAEATIDYLNLPLLYRIAPRAIAFTPRIQPYAVIGPYVGVQVGTGGNFADADIPTIDYGGTIGAGISGRITRSWIVDIEAEYSQGLTNLLSSGDATRRNRSYLVSIGLTFDLGGDYDGDGRLNRHETANCRTDAWNLPEDYDGWEDEDGCPEFDNDKDETPDQFDRDETDESKLCINDAEDRDGYEDLDGCPDPDNDQDGVIDAPQKDDQCPNEPYWLPFDRPEGDYKSEKRDGPFWKGRQYGCPGTYKYLYVNGCLTGLTLITPIDQFDRNDASLKSSPDHKAVLDEVALFLNHYPWIRLEVRGHLNQGERRDTDKKRAEAARKYLIDKGIDQGRLVAKGLADKQPFSRFYPAPTAVKKPAEWSRKDQQRLKELESQIADLSSQGVDIQSADYGHARQQIDELAKRRRAIEKQQKAYQQYKERLDAYNQLMQGAQNADRNRRVTFGIIEQ